MKPLLVWFGLILTACHKDSPPPAPTMDPAAEKRAIDVREEADRKTAVLKEAAAKEKTIREAAAKKAVEPSPPSTSPPTVPPDASKPPNG